MIDSYEVMWQLSGSEVSVTVTLTGSTTSYTITGLESDSTYSITVTAVNAIGNTSSPVFVSTHMAGS